MFLAYSENVDNQKFDSIQYCLKVLKSPLFWIVFLSLVIFYKAWQTQYDPMAIPYPPALLEFSSSRRYLSSNFAALNRLGNHLFEVISISSIAKKLKRTPLFFIQDCYHEKMLEDLNRIVPDLMEQFVVLNGSVPKHIQNKTFHESCCKFQDPVVLEYSQDVYLHLNGTHYQSWKYFPNMRNDVLDFLIEPSNDFYYLPKSSEDNFVKCIHVRRGDFIDFLIPIADKMFVLNAMKFIDNKEKILNQTVYNVFFGDDPQFLEELKDGTKNGFVSINSPADDLLYSKENCDVVLITAPHSTFGWWLAYFSKGNQAYYSDITYTEDSSLKSGDLIPSDYFLPHWTPLKYSGSQNLSVVESTKYGY